MTEHHGFSEVWRRFEQQSLTHSMTHYLLAIEELRREYGYARLVDVARRLGITKGAASIGLRALRTKGYVREDENRILYLAEPGTAAIHKIIVTRDVFFRFFHDHLGIGEKTALEDACKLEHLVSLRTTEALQRFLGKERRGGPKDAKPRSCRATAAKPAPRRRS